MSFYTCSYSLIVAYAGAIGQQNATSAPGTLLEEYGKRLTIALLNG